MKNQFSAFSFQVIDHPRHWKLPTHNPLLITPLPIHVSTHQSDLILQLDTRDKIQKVNL